jgi:hypothetical protein
MTFLLQSPIRCCDTPAGGGFAPRSFDVLPSTPKILQAPRAGLTTRLGDFATNRHE